MMMEEILLTRYAFFQAMEIYDGRQMRDGMRQAREAGVTFLEIIIAMLILGLVTAGVFTAFVFGYRVNLRAEGELMARNYSSQTMEQLRLSVSGVNPNGGLVLQPGVWVDDKLFGFPNKPPNAVLPTDARGNLLNPNPLNLPADFAAKYQTNRGTASDWTNHGDGRILIIEDASVNLDDDPQKGLNFTGTAGNTDIYRVKVKVKWSTPNP